MKKLLAIFLTLTLVFVLGVNAVAVESSVEETSEESSFVESPVVGDDVILIDATLTGSTVLFDLFVTSYNNRELLADYQQKMLEDAFADISASEDLSELVGNIGEVLSVPSEALAIGTLFFTHVVQIARVAATGEYVIEVKCDGLDRFAGLLNYTDETWSVVESAEINEDGNLVFITEALDVFAVVLDTSEEDTSDVEDTSDSSDETSDSSDETSAPVEDTTTESTVEETTTEESKPETDSPSTGEDFPWPVVILGIVAVIGIIVIAVTSKKKK